MEQQQIKACIDAMAASDLAEMEFSQEGWTLRLVRRTNDAVSAPPTTGAPDPFISLLPSASATTMALADAELPVASLRAPLYGVVHLSPGPGEPPFVAVGQTVTAGQTLCVIEAMKVFNQVLAEHDAVLQDVLVSSGQEVEAGQPLMRFA
ncbi:MAG: acetyl-CoA carboxylase biotin carboxyl carrier protein subunit [Burkholderiales bacterium]